MKLNISNLKNRIMKLKILIVLTLLISFSDAFAQIYSVGNYGGYSSSSIGGTGTEVPLPINLLWFKAKCNQSKVKLNWTTASETNNDYFTIERSSDAINFEAITTIKGAGNSNQNIKYEFTDQLLNWHYPLSEIIYYRLKQTDYDGQFEYFKIVAVRVCQNYNKNKLAIYPNPSTGTFFIEGVEQDSRITIMNALGQIVLQYKITEEKTTIDLNNQQNGIYYIRLISKNEIISKKIIIHN